LTSGRPIATSPDRRIARLILRLAVAALLTAYILWKSDPRAVLETARGAAWRPIAAACLLVLVDRALMAYRWVALLGTIDRGSRPPLTDVIRIFFVSSFVGTFLPASIGGDAVRAYSLAKLNVDGSDAVASVFMDRMLGVASIFVMAVAGLTVAPGLVANETIVAALGITAAACAVTLLVIFSRRTAVLAAGSIARLPARLERPGGRMLESIRRYSRHQARLANVLACSIAVQFIRVLQAYFLGVGLGIALPLTAYIAFIPLILLVMLLPVTFNGIGTSQAAFVWFFTRAGVPAPPAFALSVLFVALGIIGNLPGGILYALGRRERTGAIN
jgi:uncharacterized protein (TIRG00374 family)